MESREGSPVEVLEKKPPQTPSRGHHEQQVHRAPRALEKPSVSKLMQTTLRTEADDLQAEIKFGKKELPQPQNGEVEGKMQNDNSPRERIVRPLKSVEISDARGHIKNHTEEIQKLFDNLAATRGIEADTPRTQFLQEVVDKMLEGEGIETKIYILTRGLDSNAFAVADGSIFISQSLIDNLDTVDELVGVIGHEVGHLKYQTFENVLVSHDPGSTGWIHESASDSLAPGRLEKTGYNSGGFGGAIKKISSQSRDFEHQSGLLRATQSHGQHMAEDYSTSSVEQTALPDLLKGDRAQKTNWEIVKEALEKENFTIVNESLPFLAPPDLRRVFDDIISDRSLPSYKYYDRKTRKYKIPEEYFETLGAFQSFFAGKLRTLGFSESDINTYLFLNNGKSHGFHDFSFLDSPQDLVNIFENFKQYEDNERGAKIESVLFNKISEFGSPNYSPSIGSMFIKLNSYSYNPQKREDRHGILLNQDTFIELLKTIDEKDSYLVHQQVLRYMDGEFSVKKPNWRKRITSNEEDEKWNYSLDIPNAEIFLRKIHLAGINLNRDSVNNWLGLGQPKGNRKLYRENFKELIWKKFGFSDEEREPSLDVIALTDDFIAKLKAVEERPPSPSDFLYPVRNYFERVKTPDSQKTEFLNQLLEKVDTLDFESEAGLSPQVRKYMLKEFFVMGVFIKDSPQFYEVLEKVMNTSGIDFENMDWFSKIDLASNLLQVDKKQFSLADRDRFSGSGLYTNFQVTNFTRFSRLSHFQQVIEGMPTLDFKTIGQLNEFNSDISEKVAVWDPKRKLYEDDVISVLIGSPARKAFEQLVTRGAPESEFGELAEFLTHNFPDSPQTNSLLREIDKRYLSSAVSLSDKSDYLEKNFDRVGPDGMVTIAEQINSLTDYDYFSARMTRRLENYLGGSDAVKKMAQADYITSQLSGGHRQLFKTLSEDPLSSSEASSEIANNWFNLWMEADRHGWKVKYEKDSGKFEVDASGRQMFKSVSDTFDKLHNLSRFERFGIALKALVDQYGALTSERGKETLRRVLPRL